MAVPVLILGPSGTGKTYSLRPVKGFDGYYVTKDGKVWSAKQSGKWLYPTISSNGYLTVGLMSNGRRLRRYVHRLVAEAWITNPDGLPEVNHKDENKTNNTVENLEWCTSRYNSNYGTRNKRISKPVINIDTGHRFESTLQAAKSVNVSPSMITEVCHHNPRRKTAGGYRWKFEREVV